MRNFRCCAGLCYELSKQRKQLMTTAVQAETAPLVNNSEAFLLQTSCPKTAINYFLSMRLYFQGLFIHKSNNHIYIFFLSFFLSFHTLSSTSLLFFFLCFLVHRLNEGIRIFFKTQTALEKHSYKRVPLVVVAGLWFLCLFYSPRKLTLF